MENQIKNFKALKGKTIVDVLNSNRDIYLKFDDGTFAVVCIDSYDCDKTDSNLVTLGIVSKKEYKLACENEEKVENERLERYELNELERLKNKYNK